MTKKRVYLAGPISGLTHDESVSWRQQAADFLRSNGIDVYSPMRAKEYLRDAGVLEGEYKIGLFSSSRNIMTRDHDDCRKSDIVIANFLGATQRASIGSCMEAAWCYAYRVPLITVIEDEGNIHDHPMMNEAFGYRVNNIEDALTIAVGFLLPR